MGIAVSAKGEKKMPKYIDIDGYRKLFDEEYKETKKLIEQGETHLDNLAEGFHEASQVIDRIPTADVQEVRHGKWIDEPSVKIDAKRKRTVRIMIYKCSLCNTSNGRIKNAPYCPNCGARMDESGTDTNDGSRKE